MQSFKIHVEDFDKILKYRSPLTYDEKATGN